MGVRRARRRPCRLRHRRPRAFRRPGCGRDRRLMPPGADLLVNIDVDDLDKAVRFYGEAFGLEVGRRFGEDAVEMLGAAAPIYLLRKPSGSSASSVVAARRDYS